MRQAERTVHALLRRDGGAHAVLFYGAEGAGKASLARNLARGWLCRTPIDGLGCGECGICRSVDAGRAVDLVWIAPQGASRIIHLSAIVATNESESVPVTELFRTMPLMGRHKVVVIEDADRMNAAAYNALLKTLEEPGSHGRLILTTSAISRIPATIRSRCLAIQCALADPDPDLTEAERVCSEGAAGVVERVRKAPEVYRMIHAIVDRLATAPRSHTLALGVRFTDLAEQLQKPLGLVARAADTEALRALAACVIEHPAYGPEAAQAVAETHRLVQGNGNMAIQCDALFVTLKNTVR